MATNSAGKERPFARYLSFSIMNVENGDYYLPVMEKAAAAGVNTFLLNVNWDHVIRARGAAADWSQLDKQAELAERLGCKLIIKVWLARHDDGDGGWWPEGVRPISGEGVRHRLVNGFSYSASSAVEEANSFFRTVMEHFRPRQQAGQIVMVTAATNNASEIGYSVDAYNPATGKNELQSFDFSSYSKAAFREWVEAKYKTLSDLNKAWNSDYSRFSDVHPPYTRGDVWSAYYGKIGLDWYLFRHYALRNAVRKFRNTSKEVDPSYKFFLDMGSSYDGLTSLRGTFGFKDIVGEADGLKVNDGPNYPHRFAMDLLRTNLPGKMIGNEFEFISPETASQWPNQVNQSFEHGANWINIFGFDNSSRFPYVEGLIKATAAKWLHLPVPDIQPAQTVTYTLSEAIRMGTGRVQGQWREEYAKTYAPIKVVLVEDALTEVIPENQSPVVNLPLANQSVQAGKDFQYSIPEGTFSDPDGYVASITVTGLPEGIFITGNILTGKTSQIGEYTVTVTARDNAGAQVSTQFRLTVSAVPPGGGNQPPAVSQTIPNQTATAGTAFSYSIPANTFTDAETPSQLTLSVGGLPAGLTFTAPATISGTPTASGTSSVTVTATDPGALSASAVFTIAVSPASGDPTGTFAITGVTTISCSPVPGNANQRSLTFTPQYSGVNGQPITFSVARETGPTTAPGPYTLTVYMDNPGLTLRAIQQGTGGQVSFVYNWLAVCGTSPTNTPPTVAKAIPDQTATVGQAFSYEISKATFTDSDGTVAGVSFAGLPAGIGASEWKLSGTPTAAGDYTVTVTARDNAGAQVSTQFRLKVKAGNSDGNQYPEVRQSIPDQTATVGSAFSYDISKATFLDPDGPVIDIAVTGLAAGVSQSDWRVAGTPTTAGVYTVTVTARDNRDLKVSTQFKLTVTAGGGNQPPVVARAIPDQSATVGASFTYEIPKETFTDADGTITGVSFAGLSAGVSATEWKLSGTPTAAGDYTVTVTARDNAGAQVSTQFRLTVSAVPPGGNQPPVVSQTIPNQTATAGTAFSYSIPANTFTDAETPSQLTLSAGGLPAGLMFTAPATISGTPTASGTSSVTVTATDPGALSASTVFTLTVNPASGDPTGTFAITGVTTISCSPVPGNPSQRSLTFTPQYSGVNGQPITFSVARETLPTTAPGPYTLTVYMDNPGLTLRATQQGTGGQVSFVYNWLAVCGTSPTNTPPTLAKAIPDQTATVGQAFSYEISKATFTDSDGTVAGVSFAGLPAGIGAAEWKLSGTPTAAGDYTVTVSARDNAGAQVSTQFKLTVSAVSSGGNQPPVVARPIPDQSGTVGATFTYEIPKETFTDADGTVAGVSFSGLPAGVGAAEWKLSGTPTAAGAYTVTVTARDNAGAQVSTQFRLTVSAVPLDNTISLFTAGNFITRRFIRDILEGDTLTGEEMKQSVNIMVSPKSGTVGSYSFALSGPVSITSEDSSTPYGVFGDNGGNVLSPGKYTLTVKSYTNAGLQGPLLSQQVVHFVVMEKTGQQNLPPVLKNPPGNLVAKVGKPYTYRLPDGIFVDPDGFLTSFAITELPEGLKGDGTLISGTPTKKGAFTSKVRVTDNGGSTAETTFQFTVSIDNLPPVVKGSVPDLIAEVNKPFTFTLPNNIFADPDGTITAITFIGPPEGTTGQGYSITGVPNKVRDYPIIVIASDDENANAQITFTIRVVEANRPPVVAKGIGDQTADINVDYRFVIPEGTFVDTDGRIARTEFSGLPPGVQALGDTINGRPNRSGEYVVSVRAYDEKGASVQTTFKLTVKAAKQSPTVAPISDVIAIVGQIFTFDVKSYFKDDEGTLTSIIYTSALPPGITANGSQLSGNPTAVGVYPMKVVAKDKNGGSIEASFQLKVEKPVLRVLLYAMGQGTKKLIREVANTDKMAVDTLPPALNLFVESNATLTSVTFEIVNPMQQRSTDEAAPFGLFGDTGSFPAAVGTYTINILGYRNTTLVTSRLIEFVITKTANSPGRLGTFESEYFSDVELWKPYPAPFVDRVKVQTAPQGHTQLHAVEVLSSEGKILPLPTSKWTVDQSLLEVDLSETVSLPGVYLLRITEDNGKQRTLRILKAAEH